MNKHTLYIKKDKSDHIVLVCIYVDDMICMGSSLVLVEDFKSSMRKTFEMTDLGLLSYFLDLEVKQGHNSLFITQKKYIQDLLKTYNMQGCKAIETPLNIN